jgi:hypothetical protein
MKTAGAEDSGILNQFFLRLRNQLAEQPFGFAGGAALE